ncbi:BRCA2-interacting transcriptional repressor EMSY isoform X2 [Neodiprion fabricii]|uniref:BRCA2-interacting transcriptional repressor EMSY isoform X2 n=1 Tax=Neodiprion fabricii TaxID=2872261 RepID=UPI001ED91F7A|nr:BRCA2-interacting transcriptional repressor EMSY isoform X2 [Neodiprion fabricii]
MWPGRLDLSRDECKKCLRYLELEAYGNTVSVLRAQGSFTSEKQKLLQELAKALHISNERHRAEVRRAVNDEKLTIIAEQLNGPNTGTDWAIEGRRMIPLLPRLKAGNIFTTLANSLSLATSVANAKKGVTSQQETPDIKVKLQTDFVLENLEEKKSPVSPIAVQPERHPVGRKRRRSAVELQDVSGGLNTSDDTGKIVRDVVTSVSCIGSESLSSVSTSLHNKVFIVPTSATVAMSKNVIIDDVEVNAANSSCSTSTTSQQNISVHPSGSNCSRLNLTDVPAVSPLVNHTRHYYCHTGYTTEISEALCRGPDRWKPEIRKTPSVVPSKSIITPIASCSQTLLQTGQSLSKFVSGYVTVTAASKARVKAIPTQMVQPKTTPLVISTCGSQGANANIKQSEVSDIQTSNEGAKLVQLTNCVQNAVIISSSTTSACVQAVMTTTNSSTRSAIGVKPITLQNGPRMVTLNTEVASSGPGPPHNGGSTTVLTCKNIPTVKTGHRPVNMGITLNSSKSVNITSDIGSRAGAKANVIVVQKGSARGVTLSHAGKEVLGKVIVGGKNLCLSNPQSAGTIALLPHRITVGEEQSLAVLSPLNSSQPEPVKINAKAGNMIVFDLRQDSMKKNKVLSEILEASGIFSSESKTAILNTNSHLSIKEQNKDAQTPTCPISKSSYVKSGATISFVMDSKEHRKNKETIDSINFDKTEVPDESKKSNISVETLGNLDCASEIQGTLDPQTGVYSFETSENAINNIQTGESISNSGIDIFSTALGSADINLESFEYIDENDSNNLLDDAGSQILAIDHLTHLYDSQQSISDKSNS